MKYNRVVTVMERVRRGGCGEFIDDESLTFLATSTIHRRSMISKPSNETSGYTHFASPGHTTVNLSMQQPTISNGQNGTSKADLPSRTLAPFGVLSR